MSAEPAVAVVGGGPAGLMAAESLLAAGCAVDLYDAMPTVGRKFLLAGKGGLNLTHGEPAAAFGGRFGAASAALAPSLADFGADALRAWAQGLGVATFVGSSGRVFPLDLKAAPLLRAWLHRLRAQGLRVHPRCRWLGWGRACNAAAGAAAPPDGGVHPRGVTPDGRVHPRSAPPDSGAHLRSLTPDGGAHVRAAPPGAGAPLRFATPAGEIETRPAATVLALGGASWPQLGSDGRWWPLLDAAGVALAPLAPSNCGFDVAWSATLAARWAGAPVKNVVLAADGFGPRAGEFVVTATGVEGSLVYAASSALRETIAADGAATLRLDLLPRLAEAEVAAEIARPRGPRSLSTHLKSRLGLDGVKAALLWEATARERRGDAAALAAAVKSLPLTLRAARPIAEAISSAGGVRWDAVDARLMLRARPGVFVAGEMLDWEAPTGGYLMTACLATGRTAGRGAAAWLATGGAR